MFPLLLFIVGGGVITRLAVHAVPYRHGAGDSIISHVGERTASRAIERRSLNRGLRKDERKTLRARKRWQAGKEKGNGEGKRTLSS